LRLSRQSAFIIIQDEQRARLMAEDNGIEMDRFVYVPNSPVGPSGRRRYAYWHRRFNLPPDKRIVLHAGSIDAWTGIEDIVASMASWPKDCVLVVHTRGDEQSSTTVERLRKLAPPDRVLFSLTPVPRQEYIGLIDDADIGIVFYVPIDGSTYTQENIRTIGLSSGKIAYYLRAGLPVVVNRASSIGEVIDHEGCGVSVEDGHGVADAITGILGNYETFSRQARRLFDERLDFARFWRSVIDRIEQLEVPSRQVTWRKRKSDRKTMQPA
jgi:glycosyltransferase involved in cell wall biosynthesis